MSNYLATGSAHYGSSPYTGWTNGVYYVNGFPAPASGYGQEVSGTPQAGYMQGYGNSQGYGVYPGPQQYQALPNAQPPPPASEDADKGKGGGQ